MNKTQFKKAIKCIVNDLFKEYEIELLYKNLSEDNLGVDKNDFFPISNKIIENILDNKIKPDL